jgi:hypothetical protein
MFARAFRTSLLFPVFALILAPAASAQSAADVLETATARFEERTSGIDNYTVITDVMGFEVTNYFEKQIVDGRPVFILMNSSGAEQQGAGLFYNGFMKVADRAVLEGKQSIDGYDCHVVMVDDFEGIDFDEGTPDDEEDFRPRKGTFYLDTSDYLIRRLEMDGEFNRDGTWQPMTMEIAFKDYRDVEGMLHPFVADMSVAGLQNAMTEEELQEAREGLEEMKRQLAEMPESQRATVERMMAPQIEQLEQIVNSGSMQISTQVKDLKVNTGPPN